MKQLNPHLANSIVKLIGFQNIYDESTFVTKQNIERAFKNIDDEFLKKVDKYYKNDVRNRIQKGIKNRKHFMTLVRRMLRRHNVYVNYNRKRSEKKVFFEYKLVRV